VAALLHARGFTALATREVGQLQNSDAEQLAYAVSQRKTFLTHNRADFEALAKEYLAAGGENPLWHHYRCAPSSPGDRAPPLAHSQSGDCG